MTVRPKHHSVVAAVYSLALTLLILGPLLGPGYLLLRDAVSTPRSYLTDSALGLTDAAARAVHRISQAIELIRPVFDNVNGAVAEQRI